MQRLVIVMQCLGVAELTGGTALQYEVEVKNKFQTLESIEEETVPNLLWESTRNIMVDVAEKVIGYRKTKWVKPWITEETYSLTEDKRQARQSDLAKYKELKKVVQKSLRKDKDRYITALCEDLEEANDKGNMRKMYKTVRSLTQKLQPMQVAARWKEYCEEPFEDNNNSVNLPQSVHVQPEPPPLRSEVARAIDAIANNKSPGLE